MSRIRGRPESRSLRSRRKLRRCRDRSALRLGWPCRGAPAPGPAPAGRRASAAAGEAHPGHRTAGSAARPRRCAHRPAAGSVGARQI
eukprot:scaffold34218_cov33-Prasinocladus_malaysianus.AAC.1